MIYATVNMTVGDYSSTCDQNIVLYRGDKNVEIRFVIKGNRFTVLDSTYAQMIIRRPSSVSIFSEPAAIQNDTVIFTITEDMVDELKEVGEYTFQIRLYDNSMNARATLPPCNNCLIINQPIAVEGEALVNAAMVNASAILAAESDIPEDEIFTEDNAYNRTVWMDGDIITDARMNKIENALYYINEKGGGGTATAPYISTSLPETVMVGSGEDFELDLDFSSPNLGKGTLKVFINDVDSMNLKIDQGMSITTIPGSLFSKGTNMVVIYVLDRVGMMSNSLTFYVRYGGTEVTSTFDAYTSYDYGATVRYYFTPTALDTSLQLTFYMEIDGTTQAGVPCISDVRSYYTFPTNLSVGNHYCRAWVTDGTTRSNVLTFNLIILDATSLVVATDTLNPTVEEGTQLVLDYKVYMKNNTSFITKTYVDNNLINTGTCTLETAYYRTTTLTAGTHTIKVEVFDVTETYTDFVTWTVTVTESTYTMLEPAKAGSIFMATAYNKSNVDENREVWIGSTQDDDDITASLSNFSFNSENGWIDDALVISGHSWVEIPIQPLANNAQYGFTLDIEFKTKAIGVEDAEVLTLWDETDNCGIKITTEQLILRSKTGNQCDLYFAEDEIVSAIFVIDRDEKTAKIYLNGVMCEAFALSDYEAAGQKFLEDFTVNSNVYLGGYNKNGYCAIKNIRIYEVALATNEILNNFMSNEKDKAAQRELVEFQKGNTLPTLTIYCDFSGLGKDDKKPCNIVYNSPDVNLYGESFTLDGKHSMLQYQGTSSMQYPIKNYRINPRNADGKVKLDPFNNGVGESRFTLKADFMSSGHWQNTGLAKWVNDKLYNYNVNDESTMNARKWYDLQNGGSLKGTRESINGFPCRLILVNDGETALNEGQQEPTPGNTKDMGIFNFNNDKDNVETLGFDTEIFPNCMSFEVTANSDTSAGAFVPFTPFIRVNTTWTASTNQTVTAIPVDIFGAVPWKCPNVMRVRFYDDNGTQVGDNWNRGTDITSIPAGTTKIHIAFESLTADTYINDIKIIYVSEPLENGLEIAENELEYLQNSFELRYPDSDDVGKDYGYLGLNDTFEYRYIDYYDNYGNNITTKMSVDYFGTRTINITGGTVAVFYEQDENGDQINVQYVTNYVTLSENTKYFSFPLPSKITINGVEYRKGKSVGNVIKDPYVETVTEWSQEYGLKRVIDWVGNCTDEEFVAEFDQYFHRDYTLRYYLLVITLGMVDNLGKNMMFDTFDGKIWLPRFYDMDTICSYDNSGEIKFDVDIEMEQGYWNTSASRLWTKIRDLMHDELVEKYNNMRQNGMSYESFMSYFYDKQIAQIPQTYYNKDYDVKYAPYANEYMGKAHGDGYEHLKRWLKRRLIFTDTLFDYAPSYENDKITIRANTLDLMSLEIETYTPVYQHISFYNGNMEKAKIDGKTSTIFTGTAQTATDQEVLIYGGTNIKAIRGIPTMNPNSMLIGNASRLTELDLSNCPILTVVNSNKANFLPHTYLNKLDISNCPQLGGQLNISNSPLLQEVNALGSAVDNILFPTSVRNLETLRVPKTVTSLTLTDAGLLYTIEMEEGNNLQSIALTNCNNLTETINFDLTQVPTVLLDNSYNGEEIYMSATTNLTLKNMSSLKRVIFTPNSEYSAFDINNVLNGANYKITTFNNPMMTDFITTAPHRLSYNGEDVEWVDKEIFNYIEKTERFSLSDGYELENSGTNIGQLISNDGSKYTDFINVKNAETYTIQTRDDNSLIFLRIAEYDKDYNFIKITQQTATITTDSQTAYLRVSERYPSYIQITGKFAKAEIIQVKDYGSITPNTAFTANTLDLSDTQFQNMKFLCTTDIYNLKVPTTMKNFYCDSAFDIDTDVIEDASYEVIHEELIEPYTTNYEGKVGRKVETLRIARPGMSNNPDTIYQSNGVTLNSTGGTGGGGEATAYYSDYVEILDGWVKIGGCYADVNGNVTGQDGGVQAYFQFFDKDKKFLYFYNLPNYTSRLTEINDPNVRYMRYGSYRETMSAYIITRVIEPMNIIPSSANGSLIFNMYSNNTTQPTSTSPYMWDLTGLKLEDFYTYGMNNWVKARYMQSFDMTEESKYYYMSSVEEFTVTVIAEQESNGRVAIHYFDDVGHKYIYIHDKNFGYAFVDNGTWTYKNLYTSSATATKYTLDVKDGFFKFYKDGTLCYEGDIPYYTKEVSENVNHIMYGNENLPMNSITVTYYNNDAIGNPTSITMPQRMPGYSVRLVNADITPDEYPTMLYPKLIDTGLPITGKLDYTKYNGTSLAWAYAYTTGDVSINPLDSRNQGNITQDYNKLYGTDFVDIVDVWVYKDMDISKLSTNEAITKAYIEFTKDNWTTRLNQILPYYPNCTDLYFFDDGSITALNDLFDLYVSKRNQILNVTFMDGYFENLIDLSRTFKYAGNLQNVNNIPKTVIYMTNTFENCSNFNQQLDLSELNISKDNLSGTFIGCSSLTHTPILPSNYQGSIANCFQGCSSLTAAPTIPNSVTNMQGAFQNCTSLTTPPTIPSSVTNMHGCFQNCTSLTQAPAIPEGVTTLNSAFVDCTALRGPFTFPRSANNIDMALYNCTSLTEVTVHLDVVYALVYNNALQSSGVTTINWSGTLSENFNVPKLTGSKTKVGQMSIQSLVPEHLADLLVNKLTIVDKKGTLNDTYSATTNCLVGNFIIGSFDYTSTTAFNPGTCRMYKAILNGVEIIPILDESGNPCFLNTQNNSKYYNEQDGGTLTAGSVVGKHGQYDKLDHIMAAGAIVRANDITVENGAHNLEYYMKSADAHGMNTHIVNQMVFADLKNYVDHFNHRIRAWQTAGYGNYLVDSSGTSGYTKTVSSANQTLTLGETYLAYLTEDEIEQATAIGWTIQ